MNDFSVKAIYKGITLEFDVDSVDIEAALDEGKEIAKMVYEQSSGLRSGVVKKSKIYIEVHS